MSIFQKTFVILHSGSKKCKTLAPSYHILHLLKEAHEDIACLTDS